MEFKKPNKYEKGRPRLNVPERDGPMPTKQVAAKPKAKSMEFKQPMRSTVSAPRLTTPTNVSHDNALDPQPSKSPKSEPKTISINLGRLPTRSSISATFHRVTSSKRSLLIGGVVIAVIITAVTIGVALSRHDGADTNSRKASGAVVNELEYKTVAPGGKPISQIGGWKRVSPPESDPVYAYADTIDGVAISVSQQPLPATFKNDVDNQVADLAKKFNATNKLDASGTAIYIGASAKGPQSVITSKNGVLILIKSQNKIDDIAWTKYITSLK